MASADLVTDNAADNEVTYPEPDETAIQVQDTGESEGGKLKMIVTLLKKCLGVKDLAAMRLSLPASLLEPIPNLEYWQYLDRPDLFAAINDHEDPFERMLAVLRFSFSKDLKFARGKICKPYNSVLGEHFRAHWDVPPVEYSSDPSQPPIHRTHIASPSVPAVNFVGSENGSVLSFRSARSSSSSTANKRASSFFDFAAARLIATSPPPPLSSNSSSAASPAVPAATIESNLAAQVSNLSLGGRSNLSTSDSSVEDGVGAEGSGEQLRVVFLTEQVSHHPPISTFYAACPARGIQISGVDQITAKVSGTSVRIAPGSYNKGIFINLTQGPGEGEQYHISHPIAFVQGVLRGQFYATISESSIITCSGGKGTEQLRAIVEYKEESWLGKAQFAIEGIIHTYRVGDTAHEEWTKIKHVPRSCVIAYFDGSWRTRIRWRRVDEDTSAPLNSGPESDYATLIDLSTMLVVPKRVRPLDKQHAFESRRLWESVTSRLLTREYGEANKHKHIIEQRQRDHAAERKKKGEEHIPIYFEKDFSNGIPKLTQAGRQAIEEELKRIDGEP